MKMRMLLLVSSVGLLVNPAIVSPLYIDRSDIQQNLNRLYDLAEKCSGSLTKHNSFVEDVSHLDEGRCEDQFFCKVQVILLNQEDLCKREDKEVLLRTLQMYNKGRNVNCEETLQGISSPGYQISLCRFLDHFKRCVQRRNFRGTKK